MKYRNLKYLKKNGKRYLETFDLIKICLGDYDFYGKDIEECFVRVKEYFDFLQSDLLKYYKNKTHKPESKYFLFMKEFLIRSVFVCRVNCLVLERQSSHQTISINGIPQETRYETEYFDLELEILDNVEKENVLNTYNIIRKLYVETFETICKENEESFKTYIDNIEYENFLTLKEKFERKSK